MRNKKIRFGIESCFKWGCVTLAWMSVITLVVLLIQIIYHGLGFLDVGFFTHFPSRFPEKAGVKSALAGTFWILTITGLIAIPMGVGAALFLEEYAPKGRLSSWINVNISNLAAVPSIVYGLLGLALFVRYFQLGRSLLAGSLTLSIIVLPIIIITTRESIKAVPISIRQGAYAIGASRFHVVFGQILPTALPGIMTGIILALSRAIGESAPLIMIGALSFIAFLPQTPMDPFTVLPVQIFNWASRPQASFHDLAASGIIVLLIVLFGMNSIAVWIRHRSQKMHTH
jgi:phosphate transport system permease protein